MLGFFASITTSTSEKSSCLHRRQVSGDSALFLKDSYMVGILLDPEEVPHWRSVVCSFSLVWVSDFSVGWKTGNHALGPSCSNALRSWELSPCCGLSKKSPKPQPCPIARIRGTWETLVQPKCELQWRYGSGRCNSETSLHRTLANFVVFMRKIGSN